MKKTPYYGPGEDAPNPREMTEDSGRRRWWTANTDLAGKQAVSHTRAVFDDQEAYQASCERHYRLYRNMSLMGSIPQAVVAPALAKISQIFGIPASLNIVRPMINTVVSMSSINRVRALWDTSGASRELREQAKLLEKYGDGMMEELDGHARGEERVQQAAIFGTGFSKEFIFDGKPCIDPVFTPEVLVDQIDGMYRDPRSLMRLMYIDRDVLADAYPKKKEKIKSIAYSEADTERIWWKPQMANHHNMVLVTEACHLPSRPGAKDGRLVLGCGDVTLEDITEFDDPEHMYNDLRWTLAPHGYYGIGIAEELIGIQLEINRLVRHIQSSIRLLSNPYIAVDANGTFAFTGMKDAPGTVLKYAGKMPQITVPQTVHQEVFTFLNMLYQRGWETIGMNQLAATGQVPKRFSSGRAQEINLDIQNARFAWFMRQYERSMIRSYRRLIQLGKKSNMKVRVYDRKVGDMLKWSNMKVDLNRFLVKPWPTDILGNSPQSKQDAIDWLVGRGLIQSREAQLDLIASPDLEKYTRRSLAGPAYVEEQLQDMLNGEPYRAPPSEVDLGSSIATAQDMILEALYDKVEPKNISKVQQWVRTAQRMELNRQKRQQFAQQMASTTVSVPPAAGAPPGAAPPGAAGPMPGALPGPMPLMQGGP